MFRAYLDPPPGGTTVCIQKFVLIILFRKLSFVLVGIQQDEQLILSIFLQHLHVSDVSRPTIRKYNRMYTKIGTYYSF